MFALPMQASRLPLASHLSLTVAPAFDAAHGAMNASGCLVPCYAATLLTMVHETCCLRLVNLPHDHRLVNLYIMPV